MENLFRRLVTFTADGVYRYTFSDGRILLGNRGFIKIMDLDLKPEDLPGRYLKDLMIYTEKAGLVREQLQKHGEIHGFEYHFKTLKGEDRWVLHDSFIVKDDSTGEPIVEAIVRDITARKLAEQAIHMEKERLAVTLESIGDGVISTDMAGRVVVVNGVAEKLTGWPAAEAKGRPVHEIFNILNEQTRRKVENPVQRVFTSGQVVGLANHTALIARDGTERSIADSGAPIRDRDGSIIGAVLVFRDVTEERRTHEALKVSEARYRSLIENMQNAFAFHRIELDDNGRPVDYTFLEINSSFEEMTGLRRSDVVGRRLTEVLPGITKDSFDWIGVYGNVALSGTGIEFEQYSVALKRWYSVSAYSPMPMHFACVFLDVTELKNAQERIIRLNRMYSALSHTNQALVRHRDRDKLLQEICDIVVEHGQFKMAWIGLLDPVSREVKPIAASNVPAALADIKLIAAESPRSKGLVGTAVRTGKHCVSDDINTDCRIIPAWRSLALQSGIRSAAAFPIRLRKRIVGAFIVYEGAERSFTGQEIGLLDEMSADISMGLEHIEEEKLRKGAEESLRKANEELEDRVKQRTQALQRANEMLQGEIRERRRTEENIKKINKMLAQRTKQLEAANKELEAFSYSVSHDLRTPLYSIEGFAKVLTDLYADKLDDQGREFLQYIREACGDLTDLIDGLLRMSVVTRSEMHVEDVDLTAIAKAISNDLRKAHPARSAELIIDEGLKARGDARLIRVLIENLLNNAWKFTGKKRKAKIRFGAKKIRRETIFFVKDNGAGFDMSYAGKLFGDFQRLHSTAEFPGTGIGLGTVKRIVSRHGGRVWAEGAVGKGATFYFTLE
jgi:PAS domain S-box-containing protein